ncbi:RDD family protein [Parasphingopyxis lamellibrachiae]|uniref:Putative RDD family membrane protein YckC n=1 Tax=Parasphingopyxis lamellibrachiae TaxID=680125 RepID=A0A3D9FG72_9SPHN|nr:RDD family protein [Parasphingopyxis lamellibrachiae]RED16532.1 putative RDD family membrane protein YckC [Parasphingopyxis lamellibrachiae]
MASASPAYTAAHTERTLITPEGVDLRLKLATAGQRAGAFILDFLLLIAILVVFSIVVVAAGLGTLGTGSVDGIEIVGVIWLLGFFLLRNFYFIAFEMGRRSATLGKRVMGLRVVARDGGRLTADAVIARNMMREIEIFLPLAFLGGGEGVDGVIALIGLVWAGLFLFFPLFNRDRLRAGDIIAGTWVVHAPRRKLAVDLASENHAEAGAFAFTDAQLDAYGEYELQTLENVLRSGNSGTEENVAATIRGKIGWDWSEGEDDRAFLSAYYSALSTRLERRMLFGNRRLDKFDSGEAQG